MPNSSKTSRRDAARRQRRRALSSEQAVFEKLREVRQEREPYATLNRRIVEGVLQRFPALEQGPVVEIGAGDGQLLPWMPAILHDRMVLTEPTRRGADELERRFSAVRVIQASSNRIPLEAGKAALAIGLCVFDVIDDLQPTIAELGRVLEPGAAVIHLLDQSPFLRSLFQRLLALDLVLLPNVLGDPCASHWPEDILCVEQGQLGAIANTLGKHRHPVSEPLSHYLKVFRARPPAVDQALLEFDELSRNAGFREVLAQGLRAAYQLASPDERDAMGDFRGHLLSSPNELGHRLRTEFGKNADFEVEYCDIVATAELLPAQGSLHYMSVCTGQHRELPTPPERRLVESKAALLPGQMLREAGMLVFVARKRQQHG